MKDASARGHIDSESKAEAADAERDLSIAELQAVKKQSQLRDHLIALSADVSRGEMLLLRPERLRGAKVRWPKASLL
jgi:hypothetical protein